MNIEKQTVGSVVAAAAGYLGKKGVPDAEVAAALLMSRLLKCRRLALNLYKDQLISTTHLEAMRRGVKRVANGEPVQYVLGEWDFMGRTFRVDRRALIPRPETEVLVENALRNEQLWRKSRPVIVDIGTGCGCIAVTLALECPHGLYLGLDVSEEALSLARENAEIWNVADRVAFSCEDIADLAEPGSVDAVVANLPYIPSGEIDRLPVWIRDHEPRVALDGGPDGLSVIRDVVQDAALALKKDGFIFLEVGDGQSRRVSELLCETGFRSVTVVPDLSGKPRIVSAKLE